MSSNIVTSGYAYYPDPTQGKPVFNGSIYVGNPNTDPEIGGNQLPISVRQENGTVVAVSQPIVTSAGGVPLYNGSPVQILVDGRHSVKVLNALGAQVYYLADSTVGFAILKTYDTVALMAADAALAIGEKVRTLGYYLAGDGGNNDYEIVAAATATDDGGSYIDLNTLQAKGLFSEQAVRIRQFGANGDGATDAGAQINNALAYFKSLIAIQNAISTSSGQVVLDFDGGIYKTTISLDATDIKTSWGWKIQNGSILGHCTGKSVLDLVGSRGGHLENLVIIGDETNQPANGLQAGRTTTSGFCDNNLYTNISTIGWFSVAGFHAYAQETTTYNHCRFWNYEPTGQAAILSGSDYKQVMASDYKTLVTGSRSYINCKYINCDFRYLPTGNIATVTSITQANPAVVTAVGHPFSNGDTAVFVGLSGMDEIENSSYTIANATADTFELSGVDSTGFVAYVSGGNAIKAQTKPTVHFSRGEQHSFDTCYIVNYGSYNLEIGSPDTNPIESCEFDILYEGAGSPSHVRFIDVTQDRDMFNCSFSTYNTHAVTSLFSSDSVSAALKTSMYSPVIKVSSHKFSIDMVDNTDYFAMYDADIWYPNEAKILVDGVVDFSGKVSGSAVGRPDIVNAIFSNSSDGSFTPVVTSNTGTITSYTVTNATLRKYGRMAYFAIEIDITNAGTGGSYLKITLPDDVPAFNQAIPGRENALTGKMLQGFIPASTNHIRVYDSVGATVIATGANVIVSGFIELLND